MSLAKERVEVGIGVMSGLSICAPKITVRPSGFPLFEHGSCGRIQGFPKGWQRTRSKLLTWSWCQRVSATFRIENLRMKG